MPSAHNATLKCTPGEFDFNRDVMLQSQRLFNWDIVRNNKRNVSVRNNLLENKKRLEWNYRIGDEDTSFYVPERFRFRSVPDQ